MPRCVGNEQQAPGRGVQREARPHHQEGLFQGRKRNVGPDAKQPEVDRGIQPDKDTQTERVKKKNEGIRIEYPRFAYPGGQAGLFELYENRSHIPEDYEPILQANWAS